MSIRINDGNVVKDCETRIDKTASKDEAVKTTLTVSMEGVDVEGLPGWLLDKAVAKVVIDRQNTWRRDGHIPAEEHAHIDTDGKVTVVRSPEEEGRAAIQRLLALGMTREQIAAMAQGQE